MRQDRPLKDSEMREETPDAQRVKFERPIPVQIMAIDGTWRRACELKSVSDFDATLIVEGSVQGLAARILRRVQEMAVGSRFRGAAYQYRRRKKLGRGAGRSERWCLNWRNAQAEEDR